MKVPRFFLVLVLVISLFALGCSNPPDSSSVKAKLYDVKAKVVSVDKEKNTVTLDHDDIPGLMKAMEMTFPVQNAKVLEGIKPGDQVHGRLKATAGDHVITELKKE